MENDEDFLFGLRNDNVFKEENLGKSIPLIHFIVSPKVIEVKNEVHIHPSKEKWKDLDHKLDNKLNQILTSVSIMTNDDSENSENCPIPEPTGVGDRAQNDSDGTVMLSHFLVGSHEQHRTWTSSKQKSTKAFSQRSDDTQARKKTQNRALSETHTNTPTPFDTNHNGLPAKGDTVRTGVFQHSEPETIKCNYSNCNFSSNFKGPLVKHELSHLKRKRTATVAESGESNLASKKFKCFKCKFGTNFNKSLKRHVSMVHGKSELDCAIKIDAKVTDAIKTDVKVTDAIKTDVKVTDNSQSINFTCTKCDFVANMNEDLKKHELLVHIKDERHSLTAKVFKCSHCNYVSPFRKDLKEHESKHRETTDFKCTMCDFESKFRSSLRRHKLIHFKIEALRISLKRKGLNLGGKLLKCAKCRFSTRLKRNLIIHELKHSKADTTNDSQTPNLVIFEGKLETKEFQKSIKQNLNHAKADTKYSENTDLVPFKRNLEKKETSKFIKEESLDPNCKTFHCSVCNFVSQYKFSWKRHLSRKHRTAKKYEGTNNKFKASLAKSSIFKCSFCSYTSKWKANKLKHEKQHNTADSLKIAQGVHSYKIAENSYLQTLLKSDLKENQTSANFLNQEFVQNTPKTSEKSAQSSRKVLTKSFKETSQSLMKCSSRKSEVSQNKAFTLTSQKYSRKYSSRSQRESFKNCQASAKCQKGTTEKKQNSNQALRQLSNCKLQDFPEALEIGVVSRVNDPIVQFDKETTLQSYKTVSSLNLQESLNKNSSLTLQKYPPKKSVCSKKKAVTSDLTPGKFGHRKIKSTENKRKSYRRNSGPISREVFSNDCSQALKVGISQMQQTTEIHLKTPKLYRCPECNYQSTSKPLLKGHQLIHLPVKQLKCSYCPNYKTNLQRNLRQHEWTHMKEKRFTCYICGYKTNYSSVFKRHKQRYHKQHYLKS